MKALHSSSALAVNFFDVWTDSDAQALMRVFGLAPDPVEVRFEVQYPTGLPGNPPNLDVVLRRDDGFVIAIESKFTEWITPKAKNKPPFKEKCFESADGVWQQVGLPLAQRLAEGLQSGIVTLRHLDVPQLLKHALSLATHLGSQFRLFYVFDDGDGKESKIHRSELAGFSERMQTELGFRAFSYQDLFSGLQRDSNVPAAYLEYLQARYF